MALETDQQRFGVDAEQAGDLGSDVSFQGRSLSSKRSGLQAAADEGAQ